MSISGESSGGLATSPELLTNTPSNIARLEDAIEHCEARHKYRTTTGSPSDGDDVRWYFCKVPLAGKELAASVPHSELIGKSDYFRFSMRDSLALEASFLQREEELLSYWWKEYAESSAGPSKSRVTSKISSDVQLHEEDYSPNELYTLEEERVGVPVKGGLYEVDLLKRHCFPVYWDGENRRVLRGHWFARKGSLDWLPLREDISEQLELAYHCRVWHRRRFQQSGLFAARVDIQGTTEGLHALFTGEDDTWEAWLGVDSAGISLGWGKGNGFHLRRGFSASGSSKPTQDELRQKREEEMDDYCSQVPVGHLVFMVHGIGQRLEKANLVDDVGNFRHITARLAERFLSPYQRSIQRVLFIPCQWRKGLKLRGESAVEKITLDGIRGLRVTLGATAHDVLYYMSPIYCQDIIDSVSNQLNKLYKKFLKRNPGYDGKVSLYGHSLGSVLSYDILCHQESLTSPFPMESLYVGHYGEKKSEVEQLEMPCQVQNESTTQSNGGPEGNPAPSLMVLEGTDCVQSSISECSPTSELEQSCSIPGKDSADIQVSEGHQNADLHIGSCSSKEDHVKDMVIDNGASDDTHEVSGGRSEDHYDKDEVISLLKEEVQTLKLKIAELEKMKQPLASKSTDNIENSELLNGKENNEKDTEHSLSMNEEPDDCSRTYTPSIHYTKLEFKVDTFFAVGSPLGVFLALRNIRIGIGRGQDYWPEEVISEEMPCCRQMFNIFHPFDPVAYRIEPLICKEFVGKRPVIIPYHRGGKRLHIGFQEFTEDITSRSHAVARRLNTMTVKMINIFRKETNDMEESTNDVQANERTYGSIMMERLTGSENGRVDHMLQDKTFQHPYISALGSHTNYWRDHDTALFILKHLYRDIPEELDTDDELEKENSFEHKRRQVELFFQKEAMDEDLPLTFSDKAVIREFSRKARKSRNPPR